MKRAGSSVVQTAGFGSALVLRQVAAQSDRPEAVDIMGTLSVPQLEYRLVSSRSLTNINDTFRSKLVPSGNVVLILNEGDYVMAEYDLRTGRTIWQRLVHAAQREKIEQWLARVYPATPVPSPVAAAPVGGNKRKAVGRA